MLILNANEIRQALPMAAAIAAMREAFAALTQGTAQAPPRIAPRSAGRRNHAGDAGSAGGGRRAGSLRQGRLGVSWQPRQEFALDSRGRAADRRRNRKGRCAARGRLADGNPHWSSVRAGDRAACQTGKPRGRDLRQRQTSPHATRGRMHRAADQESMGMQPHTRQRRSLRGTSRRPGMGAARGKLHQRSARSRRRCRHHLHRDHFSGSCL